MALSRFYRPTNYEYMSQFVPKNLEIMDRGLQRAQAKQDKQVGKLDELHGLILKQEANAGWDTEVRDQVVGEVKAFSDEMANTDLTNPENFRKVNQFVQSMITDKRLADIREGVALAKEGQKTKSEYQGTEYGYIEELDPFSPAYNQYATQSGDDKKLSAEFLRGKTSWQKGVNAYETKEKMFANIAPAGLETLHKLRDGDITVAYENGWTGVTGDKIRQVAGTEFDDYLRSPAGKQEAAIRIKRNPDISRKQLGDDMLLDFLQTGLKREGVKYQSGAAAAFNSAENIKRAKAKEEEIPAPPVIQPSTTDYLNQGFTHTQLNERINTLSTSKDPKDQKLARELKAYKETQLKTIVSNLSTAEQEVVAATYDKYATNDKMKREIWENSGLLNSLDPHMPMANVEKNLLKMSPSERNRVTKQVLAKQKGLDYDDITEKIDKGFKDGTAVQKEEILLSVENQKVKTYLDKAGTALFTDINFIPSVRRTDTGESVPTPTYSLEEASQKADPNSYKIIRGKDKYKVEIQFKVPSSKDVAGLTYTLEPVLEDGRVTTATRNFLLNATDPATAQQLINEIESQNYAPIGSDEMYSQTQDMGLAREIIGDYNLSPGTIGNTVNINKINKDKKATITYLDVANDINSLIKEAGRTTEIVNTAAGMLKTAGLFNKMSITTDPSGNIIFEPDVKDAKKSADFLSPSIAQQYLTDLQNIKIISASQ